MPVDGLVRETALKITKGATQPVDPADVRKAVLEEDLPLTDPKISALRKKLFGAWEMNWMAFNVGHDFRLPPSGSAPINFFMYPEAEVKGADLDGTDPEASPTRSSRRQPDVWRRVGFRPARRFLWDGARRQAFSGSPA